MTIDNTFTEAEHNSMHENMSSQTQVCTTKLNYSHRKTRWYEM